MVLSFEPVQKKVLHGDTLIHLTHPWCAATTLYNLKGLCHVGLINFLIEEDLMVPNLVV